MEGSPHEARVAAGLGAVAAIDAIDDQAMELICEQVLANKAVVEHLERHGLSRLQAAQFMVGGLMAQLFSEEV